MYLIQSCRRSSAVVIIRMNCKCMKRDQRQGVLGQILGFKLIREEFQYQEGRNMYITSDFKHDIYVRVRMSEERDAAA